MKRVHVIGVNIDSKAWEYVYCILNAGQEVGVTYQKFDYFASVYEEARTNEPDAYVYLDIAAFRKDKPWVRIDGTDCDTIIDAKMQKLADMLFGDTPVEPKEESEQNVNDIGIKDLDGIDGVDVKIEGKQVNLNKTDIAGLSRVRALMEAYGFEIQEVIVT